MTEAWKTLAAAGLPVGAPRPRPERLDFGAIRSALGSLDLIRLDETQRVALLAWLEGWRDHWPSSFTGQLGPMGERTVRVLRRSGLDENRYLKLRRIAVENLGAAL